jgi:hypothetical protein
VAYLDNWVGAFEKSKNPGRDEFAKMLVSPQKVLGKDELWKLKK